MSDLCYLFYADKAKCVLLKTQAYNIISFCLCYIEEEMCGNIKSSLVFVRGKGLSCHAFLIV